MSFTPRKFIGAGIVSMRIYGSSDAMADMGDVQSAEFGQSLEKKTLPNLRGGQGNAKKMSRVSERTLTLGFADWVAARVAMVLNGTVTSEVAGTVTGESKTVKLGSIVRLAHILPSSIVVKDSTDTTTYTAGTHYTLTHNGIEIPPTAVSGGIADGATVHISYAYSAQKIIEAFTAGDTEWEVHIDGLNDAETGDKYTIDFWRWAAEKVEKLPLLDTDFQVLESAGELLPDSTKGTGVSAYMRIKQAA